MRGAFDLAHHRLAALSAFAQHRSYDSTDRGTHWSSDGADDRSCSGSRGGFANCRDRDGFVGAGHVLLGT